MGVLFGNGNGTFQTAVTYSSGGTYARALAVADFNGDGKPDIVVVNSCNSIGCNEGIVGVLLGNGDGTFQPAVLYGSGGFNSYSVAAADVNRDGKPDVVVANGCVSTSNCRAGNVGVLINTSRHQPVKP